MTGWAQINGRDELEIPVKAKLDGEYVRKMSFFFDIKCLFGTVFSVLRSDGVVEGGTGTLKEQTEDKTDIIFGGLSPVVTIDTVGPYSDTLLIIGDETAKSYVPFLVNHYARITIVSADRLTPELAEFVDPEEYRQVLFAFSVVTFAENGSLDALNLLTE